MDTPKKVRGGYTIPPEPNRKPDSPFLESEFFTAETRWMETEMESPNGISLQQSPFLNAFESEFQKVVAEPEDDSELEDEEMYEDIDEYVEEGMESENFDESFDELDDQFIFDPDDEVADYEREWEVEGEDFSDKAEEMECDECLEEESPDEFLVGEEDTPKTEDFLDEPEKKEFVEEMEELEDEELHNFFEKPYGRLLFSKPKRKVKHFICSEADRLEVEGVVTRGHISKEELRSVVETAVRKAVSWLLEAANALKRSRRHLALSYSGDTRQLFHEAFGTFPDFVPSWRPAGENWDRGDIVRIRLRNAAKILDGGWIKFFCWGPNQLPNIDWKPTSISMIVAKKYAIYFGRAFWEAWKNGDNIKIVSSILMTALALYYDTIFLKGRKERYGNSHCYGRFVLRFNNISLPKGIISNKCKPAPVSPRKVKKLLLTIDKAIGLMKQSVKSLKPAQQELLEMMIERLSCFFLKGHYGIKNGQGKDIRAAKRCRIIIRLQSVSYRKEKAVLIDTKLYLDYGDHEESNTAGRHRPGSFCIRSWVFLYIRQLIDRDVTDVAGVLIHEMLHMIRNIYRCVGSKLGWKVARSFPAKMAGSLLDMKAFNRQRLNMTRHFMTLIDYLNRCLHRDLHQLEQQFASDLAIHFVEELLAYSFQEAVIPALFKGFGRMRVALEIMETFLHKWFKDQKDRAALKAFQAQKIFSNMENDLKKLKKDIEKHVDR